MATEEPPPEWLPLGWTMVVSTRLRGSSAGRRDKYYTNPVDGRKFRSKNEVLRYGKCSGPENATCNPLKKSVSTLNVIRTVSPWNVFFTTCYYLSFALHQQLGLQKESDEWLPVGWITESKTRRDGRQDKYYTNPENGQRFRSKNEVLRYIRALSPEIPMEKAVSAPNANRTESNEWLAEELITEVETRTDGRQDKPAISPMQPASIDSDYLRPSKACRSLFEGQTSSNNSSGLAHEPPSNHDNDVKKIESNTNQSSDQNMPTIVEDKLSQGRNPTSVELNGLKKGGSNEEWRKTKQLSNRTHKRKSHDPPTVGKGKKESVVPVRRSGRVLGRQP